MEIAANCHYFASLDNGGPDKRGCTVLAYQACHSGIAHSFTSQVVDIKYTPIIQVSRPSILAVYSVAMAILYNMALCSFHSCNNLMVIY